MLIEKIKTPGLSHLSYLIGAGGQAAVIDPRRDCEIYVEKARSEGLRITHIFETHRNEDLVSGAPVLAELTGAEVFHGPNADGEVGYAKTTREGDCYAIGQLEIRVLETPGHTFDHVAYAVFDSEYPDKAVGVFTGDALFVGDVGRTDFYPDRKREVAGLLFDSLRKICDLGDQAIIYPAHGAGSVCGSGMAEREFSTVGHERRNNPMLQIEEREAFIDRKVNENHYQPPYFRLMEHLNLVGGDAAPRVLQPQPMSLGELSSCDADRVIDVREPLAYAAGHLPGSINLPVGMIPAFAGWFIAEGEKLALVASSQDQLSTAMEHLVSRLQEKPGDWTLLDVRDADERQAQAIEGSRHIYVGELNEKWKDFDRGQRYTLMCASGMRATVAAGWLDAHGFDHLDVYLGSMGAWKATHS